MTELELLKKHFATVSEAHRQVAGDNKTHPTRPILHTFGIQRKLAELQRGIQGIVEAVGKAERQGQPPLTTIHLYEAE